MYNSTEMPVYPKKVYKKLLEAKLGSSQYIFSGTLRWHQGRWTNNNSTYKIPNKKISYIRAAAPLRKTPLRSSTNITQNPTYTF